MTNGLLPMHTHFVKMTSTTLQSFLLTQGVPYNTSQRSQTLLGAQDHGFVRSSTFLHLTHIFWDNSWVSERSVFAHKKKSPALWPSLDHSTQGIHDKYHSPHLSAHFSKSKGLPQQLSRNHCYELLAYTFNLLTNTQPGKDRSLDAP